MSALKTEFSAGAAAGNSLSGYRGKTIYDSSTNAATTIAGSGAISFSTFRGKRALAPPGAIATAPVISLLKTIGATVMWSTSANAVSYYLTIGTSVGGSDIYSANVGNVTSAAISATFLGATSYYASVYGINAAGNGTTNNGSGYILCAAPTAVTIAVTGSAVVSSDSFNITWNTVAYASGYTWALSTSSTNTGTPLATGTATIAISGSQVVLITPSTTYYAFVYATRTESISDYGTTSYTTPAVPVVTVTTPTIAAGILSYSWSATNAPIKYYFNLYQTGNSTPLRTSTYSSAVTSGTYTSLTIGATYYITLSVLNLGGLSSTVQSSASVAYTPPVATANTPTSSSPAYTQLINGATFPATGTPITLINTGTVGWYNLIISYTISGAVTYFTTNQGSGQTVSIAAGSMYTGFSIPANITSFAIQVTNTDFSQALQLFTKSSGGLVVFTNPNPSWAVNSIVSVSTGGPTLNYTWSGTNSPTGYTVNLYASGNGTALATLTNTTATSSTYLPVNGTTYYTTVIATNAQGTSSAAQSGNFTYTLPVPTAPTNVTVAVNHTTSVITVGWTAVTGATSYTLSDGTTTATSTTTSGTLTLSTNGSKQLITVTAVNGAGSSTPSDAIGFSYFAPTAPQYTWSPPSGVSSVFVVFAGAGGGTGGGGTSYHSGGSGGLVSGTFTSITSGSPWYIVSATGASGSAAGYYGGGSVFGAGSAYPNITYVGGGGGGGSFMATDSAITAIWVAAGGGGGGAYYSAGSNCGQGTATTNIGQASYGLNGGGAGGGGYHGGAGGSSGYGGGGGTNYADNLSGTVANTSTGGGAGSSPGVASGAGYVFISWGTTKATFT